MTLSDDTVGVITQLASADVILVNQVAADLVMHECEHQITIMGMQWVQPSTILIHISSLNIRGCAFNTPSVDHLCIHPNADQSYLADLLCCCFSAG